MHLSTPESALAQLSNELSVLTGTAEAVAGSCPGRPRALPKSGPAQGSSTGAGAVVHSTNVSGQAVPLAQPPEPLDTTGQRPTLPPTQPSSRDPGQPPATLRDWAGPAPKHLEWDQVEAEDCGEQLSCVGFDWQHGGHHGLGMATDLLRYPWGDPVPRAIH